MPIPTGERLLLGPGPSPISDAVRAALAAPPRSHLDPELMASLDAIRASIARVARAPAGSLALAISGTGTSAMEAVVANLVEPGARAVAVVNGYFGARLADELERHGAAVTRVSGEWGRAIDPTEVARVIDSNRPALVAVVHGETSTGVRNDVRAVAAAAREHDALIVVDAVTTLGAVPFDLEAWDIDACYSCSQKGLGAPSGLAPVVLSPRALERRVTPRSFAFDLALLEDYWVRRKYHHTISSPLVFAFEAALDEVETEGLDTRWARHRRCHDALVRALDTMGLSLLPAETDRLWSLNAVRVPDGVDETTVRRTLLDRCGIEIGAGLGPLAGRIWRVGLMGSGATDTNVRRVTSALQDAIGRAT
jgi:alanine-glyoxylate transaminase/serine-glyoxylate transaminase/serine-pyruvate transaminase